MEKDNRFHSCTKHIDLQYHFIQEAVEYNKVMINYIPTEDNVANIFMKALPRPKFEGFVEQLGLTDEEGKKERTMMLGDVSIEEQLMTLRKIESL